MRLGIEAEETLNIDSIWGALGICLVLTGPGARASIHLSSLSTHRRASEVGLLQSL